MNICLINPPSPWLKRQNAFPPLGLLYLANAIQRSHEVSVVDFGNEVLEEEEIDFTLCAIRKADIYGITSSTPQYKAANKIKDALKSNFPDAKIVIGGSHATYMMNGKDDGYDWIIKGEGEWLFYQHLNVMNTMTSGCLLIKDIHLLDIDCFKPARDLINLKDYKYFIGKDNLPATTIITSRGCPYSCGFCAKTDNNVRFHSAEYVCAEINEIKDKYGFDNLLFLDDCFTLNEKRLVKILAHTKKRNIKFRCYIRSDTPMHILKLLKESGCVEAGMGIESGSQYILDSVCKKTSNEQNTEIVKYCEGIGLPVNAFLMIGLPGETKETAQQTVQWVRDAKPTKFGYNIFVPYPGSDIYNNRDKYDITIHEMPNEKAITKGDPDSIESFVSTPSLSKDQISDLFHKSFNDMVEITGWNPAEGEFIN